MKLDQSTSNLCFDDILLVPKHSNVATRSDIKITTTIGNPNNRDAWIFMDNPFVLAPMEFITSTKMIESVLEFGGIALTNRFKPREERISQTKYLIENSMNRHRLGATISNNDIFQDEALIKEFLSMGVKIILIDTAFGHTQYSIDAVRRLREIVPNYVHIMTGNVSSYEAYRDLMDAGADSVRVGIGGGAACTTRVVTGFGVPVLASIMDVYEGINKDEINGLVSDGGITSNGDITKALAAGASAVMMGSMFAGHEECDGMHEGKFLFRGLASAGIQLDPVTGTKPPPGRFHVEGVSGYIENKGPVSDTINQMINNVKSGMSYSGCESLESFRKESTFIKVSPQSLKESANRI
jgi:IMP dehydrogenase